MARNSRSLLKKKFHAALGRFLSAWAEVETLLDFIVIALNISDPDPEPNRTKRRRYETLARKIARIRKKIPRRQTLNASRDAITIVLNEVERLAYIRNRYVHKTSQVFKEIAGETIVVHSSKSNERRPKATISEINVYRICTEDIKRNIEVIIFIMFSDIPAAARASAESELFYDAQLLDAARQMRQSKGQKRVANAAKQTG